MPKRARHSYPEADGHDSWRQPEYEAAAREREVAGQALFDYVMGLYLKRKLTAQELCVIMHHCAEAGTPGGNFKRYGQAPGKQTGKYQRYLDAAITFASQRVETPHVEEQHEQNSGRLRTNGPVVR